MTPFSYLLFNLDGTVTNPAHGLGHSLRYALKQMQIDGYSDEILERFIGPPLQQGFSSLFGLNEQNTILAVEHFRTYFGDKGWAENEPFMGISELLEQLHFAGKKVYVVTSKLEKYAQMIIRHFEFDRYITDLQGADYSGSHSGKDELIKQLMDRNQIKASSSVVMIGDTHYDILGAKEQGISSIAVSFGFGTRESLSACFPDFIVDSVSELGKLLMS